MIRYRFTLLTPDFTPITTYITVDEVNAQLKRNARPVMIEAQAYDDRTADKPRAWTNETVFRNEWTDHYHDQLYRMIEDTGYNIDLTTEAALYADLRKAQEIRYHLATNLYLLCRDGKLFARYPPGRILDTEMAKHFRKVASWHWKRLTLDLFYG